MLQQKYTKVPSSYTYEADMLAFMGYLRILLCLLWLYRYFASRAMSHRHRQLRRCRNTALPLGLLCLLGLPLGLLCLLGLPLRLLCLLGLPLGLLCLLDGFASWACLIDIVCFDNAGILICLLGYAITGHSLVCQYDKLC
jgi:hypothetical protein